MKTVLVALNARFTHSNLALRYLRNEIERAGHTAVIREFSNNQNYLDILNSIADENPDVILFSVYIWNARIIRSLVSDCARLCPDASIILGGPEAGYNPDHWISLPNVTTVIRGAGETAVRELAKYNFETDKKILERPNPPFDEIPFPYHAHDFSELNGHYLYYESSRGCPFSCSYCISSRSDHNLEFRDVKKVVSEIESITAHNPFLIKFVDRSFNADQERARIIWKNLISHSGQTRYHFEIHPSLLEEDDFSLLESVPAGLFQFEIGIQSVHDNTLREIGRPLDWTSVRQNIARIIAMGNIHIHLDMIAGLPLENMAAVAHSFDEIISLGADHFQLGFLKLLPGTLMRERAGEYGMIATSEPPYQVLQTKWLSREDFVLLGKIEQLVETTWNTRAIRPLVERKNKRFGGYFAFFRTLSGYCEENGFDIRTKNRDKLGQLIGKFLEHTGRSE
jgi:radical SAM superfamily enzyme YgiQ (UPF0313 family)